MSSGLPGYFWFSLLLFSLGERVGGWGGGDIGKELFPFMFADVHALGAKKMSANGTLTDDGGGGPFVVFQTSMGKSMLIAHTGPIALPNYKQRWKDILLGQRDANGVKVLLY